MPETYNETMESALEDTTQNQNKQDNNRILLSTGVVLEAKKFNPMAIQEIAKRFPDPPVPYIYDDAKGRKEYNPQDPDYLEAKTAAASDRGLASIDTMIALGTKLCAEVPLPKDVEPIDSNDWIETLQVIGIEFDTSKKAMRYLMWVKYVACPDSKDLMLLAEKVQKVMGVSEEGVATAINSFPDQT